ncbi:MAG: hypothetical protein BWY54_00425 [Candidatus Dependentiae bacterium ADurb.Bin331]|nr:MAG: hypothetical protein BWY54_00425 [Candidatus Dependentiae bacterium ADurb.Bin331]
MDIDSFSILQAAANVACILALVLGIRSRVTYFKEEKQIEDMQLEAKNALDKLTEIKKNFNKLHVVFQHNIKNPSNQKNEIDKQIKNDTSNSIDKLSNSLLLVMSNNLIGIDKIEKIKKKLKCIKKINKIISSNYLPQFLTIDILSEIGFKNQNKLNNKFFEELEKLLIEIYQMK